MSVFTILRVQPLEDINAAIKGDYTVINFQYIDFTREIIEYVQQCPSLPWTSISLYHCRGEVDRLCLVLQDKLKILHELRLEDTPVHPWGITRFFEESKSLKTLVLDDMDVNQPFCDILTFGLQKTKSLERLVWNRGGISLPRYTARHRTWKGVDTVLLRGIQRNKTLKRIEMDFCHEGFLPQLLQVVSHHPSLTELHVHIPSPTGAVNSTLTCCIHKALQQLVQCPDSQLCVLILCLHCDLIGWHEALPTNSRIQYCLRPTKVKISQDMERLGRMLAANHSVIQELDIRCNGISSKDLDTLIPYISQSRSLERLYLHGNSLSKQGADTLLQTLTVPKSMLQKVEFSYGCPLAPEMQHQADLNRAGRRLFLDSYIPTGLWPLVLARAGKLSFGTAGIYDKSKRASVTYVLLHGPATFHHQQQNK
jgi:hypothetical protein